MSQPPFQQLVDNHSRDVARLAYGLAGPDGQDIAQQAWLQALNAYPTLRTTENLRGWLLTITYRCAMDHFRRSQRSPTPVDDLSTRRSEPTAPSIEESLPDEQLWEALKLLPHRTRTAVCLKYVADLDHKGIADVLSISPSMSRRLVSDGLKQLRRTYVLEGR